MKKKNIIITGGSKGLGREIVEYYRNTNFNVFVLSRTKIKNKYTNVQNFSVDLSKAKKTKKIMQKIRKKCSEIDLVICCTGSGKKISNDEIGNLILKKYFDINFFTISNILDSYLKIYHNKKTKFIVISSIASKKIIEAPIGYSIAKLSLDFFVKILSKKLSQYQININLISPGNMLTKNNSWDKKLKLNKTKTINYINKNVPLRKFISAKDIISIIKLLHAKSGDNITGSDFIIDGGQSL